MINNAMYIAIELKDKTLLCFDKNLAGIYLASELDKKFITLHNPYQVLDPAHVQCIPFIIEDLLGGCYGNLIEQITELSSFVKCVTDYCVNNLSSCKLNHTYNSSRDSELCIHEDPLTCVHLKISKGAILVKKNRTTSVQVDLDKNSYFNSYWLSVHLLSNWVNTKKDGFSKMSEIHNFVKSHFISKEEEENKESLAKDIIYRLSDSKHLSNLDIETLFKISLLVDSF